MLSPAHNGSWEGMHAEGGRGEGGGGLTISVLVSIFSTQNDALPSIS